MIPEVHSADFGIFAKLGRSPGGKHFAILYDVGAMRHTQGLAHLVVGNQDADSLAAQIADDFLDIHHGQGVDPRERLVQQDEGRLKHQRPCNLQPPPLAS